MRFPLTWLFVLLLSPGFAAPADESRWTPLLNDRDLAGWHSWLGRPQPTSEVPGLPRDPTGTYLEPIGRDRDPLCVFTVVELEGRPALRISGEVFGTLSTDSQYGNYHLRLQFRWGEKKWPPRLKAPRDTGVLYHSDGTDGANGAWPNALELQVQERDCGNLFPLGTRVWVTARRRDAERLPPIYEAAAAPQLFAPRNPVPGERLPAYVQYGRCERASDWEKLVGEWNVIELIVHGRDSIHVVNGHVVMRLTSAERSTGKAWTPLRTGQICLQSEGAEVFYRDVELRQIANIPPEFINP